MLELTTPPPPQRIGCNLYATLHFHKMDDGSHVQGSKPSQVPAGWQIAVGDADDIRVCGAHPWQTDTLVVANGNAYGTAMSLNGPSYKYGGGPYLTQDAQGVVSTTGSIEVLLRRRA